MVVVPGLIFAMRERASRLAVDTETVTMGGGGGGGLISFSSKCLSKFILELFLVCLSGFKLVI